MTMRNSDLDISIRAQKGKFEVVGLSQNHETRTQKANIVKCYNPLVLR